MVHSKMEMRIQILVGSSVSSSADYRTFLSNGYLETQTQRCCAACHARYGSMLFGPKVRGASFGSSRYVDALPHRVRELIFSVARTPNSNEPERAETSLKHPDR